MIIRVLAISVACLALGTPAGRAAPLEPERASDTVTLRAHSRGSVSCGEPANMMFAFDHKIDNSGGAIEAPFSIPFGKVLVVTSFDWMTSGSPAVANRARTAFLIRFWSGTGLASPSAMSTALSDAQGRAGGSETFPTGLVVQNPAQLCLQMDVSDKSEYTITGVVNGFLAPDK